MAKHKHAEVIKAWADGAIVESRLPGSNPMLEKWAEEAAPNFSSKWEYRVKPDAPERAYPVTQMDDQKLLAAYQPHGLRDCGVTAARNLANAVLRHAIDSGMVVLPTVGQAYESGRVAAIACFGDSKRDARDLAIAQAVHQAHINGRYTIQGACDMDLVALIETVK